jgi:hypothetical protein
MGQKSSLPQPALSVSQVPMPDTSLVSKKRGQPSDNRLPEAYRDLALSLVRERYADFGPTLAAEKLAEVHSCAISRETLRGRMIAAGLWVDRRHRLPSVSATASTRLLWRAGED